MALTCRHTLITSCAGYVTQAAVNNLVPLLFVTFSAQFGIGVVGMGGLIVLNFSVQIIIDYLAAQFMDRLGFRRGAVLAHIFGALGLVFLGTLPFLIEPPIIGIIISVVFTAVGGGLCEVIVSPVVESLPLENKASNMSLLHSFYCWGQMAVVLLSTLYFTLFGIKNWRFLPMIWALLPALTAIAFAVVPIYALCKENERMRPRLLMKNPAFILMLVLMLCAGAGELAMSQWASYFAEKGLYVSKTMGDLLGACTFAFMMGLARLFYAKRGSKIRLETALMLSSVLCCLSYIVAALSPFPVLSLAGCGLCGLSVGIMWPGVLSLASKHFPNGGGNMFALLALAGDVGCTSGAWLVSIVADASGSLRTGLLFVIVFPAIMLLGTLKIRKN